MPDWPRDIEAEIRFLTTEEGGRKTPAYSGYRAQIYYDGKDWDAVQDYAQVEPVLPGQEVIAYLSFLTPEAHIGKLHPGKQFVVREGSQVVASGRVTRLFDLDKRTKSV